MKRGWIIGFIFLVLVNFVYASVDNSLTQTYQDGLFEGTYEEYYNSFFRYEGNQSCCLELENGALCQNVPSNYAGCVESLIPTSCQEVSECGLGCCYDVEEGLCTTNTLSPECESRGGIADSDATCSDMQECDKGCCDLGNYNVFVTEGRCEHLSSINGLEDYEFILSLNEISCLALAENPQVGACISGEVCSFGTDSECISIGGDFHENKLCSNPELETGCERQTSISCVERKDEIYWFDSCGNIENIYSSDKDISWNNGEVLTKEESCGYGDNNIYSEGCGNCDYGLGSMCVATSFGERSVEDGDFVCSDIRCSASDPATGGEERENGESWCVYDGAIGNGTDPVGSRHWKRICIDGEVKVEPCAPYRNEVCAMNQSAISSGELDVATCRVNRWKSCLGINSWTKEGEEDVSLEDKKQACEEDVDCDWRKVQVGDLSFNLCTPKYPPGFFINGNGTSRQTTGLCSYADQTCIVVLLCGECVVNCQCLEEEFTIGMNNFCMSMGDCGAQVNYNGQLTDLGYTIEEGERLSQATLDAIQKNSINTGNQSVELGNVEDYLEDYGLNRDKTQEGTPPEQEGPPTMLDNMLPWGDLSLYAIENALLSAFIPGLDIVSSIKVALVLLGLDTLEDDCPPEIVEVRFSCNMWQAPTENQDCDACNDDPLKPCSQYRCASLGSACELLNAGSGNPICYETNKGDNDEPVLTTGTGFGLFSLEQDGVTIKVRDNESECVRAFSPIVFTLESDEPAHCRFSAFESKEFLEMEPDFLEKSYLTYNHTFLAMLPSLESLEAINSSYVKGDYLEREGKINYYVKCMDNQGNVNERSYVLDLCLSAEEDNIEPEILSSIPKDKTIIPFEKTSKEVYFYVNEPAECKFDYDDKAYESMAEEMFCYSDVNARTSYGWQCIANVTGIDSSGKTIYARCKDQPWMISGEDRKERNVNSKSYDVTLYSSSEKLEVYDLTPKGEIFSGENPAKVSISAKTSGGAKNGNARCVYSLDGKDYRVEMLKTGGKNHYGDIPSVGEGEHILEITCEDLGGNVATKQTEFDLKIDQQNPEVVRVYKTGNILNLITDEPAECYYDFNSCSFNVENAESMEIGFSTKHGGKWVETNKYYIKCIDMWGNGPSGCSIVVSPSLN